MKKLITLLTLSAFISSAQAAEPDTLGYDRFRFGGYGECQIMHRRPSYRYKMDMNHFNS